MHTDRKIFWLKWQDPLAPLVYQRIDESRRWETEEDDLEQEAARHTFLEEEATHYDEERRKPSYSGPCIVGPLGIIPLHEENLPSRAFNFWIGHTNFDLSKTLVMKMSKVPGVETLDIFTRYRFRLGIGKAFQGQQVREAVEQLCRQLAAPPKPADRSVARKEQAPSGGNLETVKAMLGRCYSHWAIYVMPDGRLEVAGGKSVEEVQSKGRRHEPLAREVVLSWT